MQHHAILSHTVVGSCGWNSILNPQNAWDLRSHSHHGGELEASPWPSPFVWDVDQLDSSTNYVNRRISYSLELAVTWFPAVLLLVLSQSFWRRPKAGRGNIFHQHDSRPMAHCLQIFLLKSHKSKTQKDEEERRIHIMCVCVGVVS